MTETELEKEILEVCKRPHKEIGIYRKTRKKFVKLNRKEFHNFILNLIYRGSLEATLNWRLQTRDSANLSKTPAYAGVFLLSILLFFKINEGL